MIPNCTSPPQPLLLPSSPPSPTASLTSKPRWTTTCSNSTAIKLKLSSLAQNPSSPPPRTSHSAPMVTLSLPPPGPKPRHHRGPHALLQVTHKPRYQNILLPPPQHCTPLTHSLTLSHRNTNPSSSKRQYVQTSAARLLTHSPSRGRITPILCLLHWLPIKQRINFRILLTTYKALNNLAPSYLTDLLLTTPLLAAYAPLMPTLLSPITKTTYRTLGDRAFTIAAPTLWPPSGHPKLWYTPFV